MSLENVNKIINRIFTDSEYKQLFSSDPDKALAEYQLTEQEVENLKKSFKQVMSGNLDTSKMCSVCGQPIIGDIWFSNLTINEIGSTRTRGNSEFFFHPECYQEGKKQLMIQLGKLPQGGGSITWDSRDSDDMTSPSEALGRYALEISFPRMTKLFRFFKNYWFILLISLYFLYELIKWIL